jgi:uncharacterized protein (TIGR00725 family)
MRKLQIAVIGYNTECTEVAKKIAYDAGKEIARAGAVLVCGGLGGVMEAACRGARENGGTTVGIIPQEEFSYANEFCDVVICTGIGYARDFVVASSADGIIAIGGGVGTLIEMGVGYMKRKVIVGIAGSGGVADAYGDKFLDERNRVRILTADNAHSAVKIIQDNVKPNWRPKTCCFPLTIAKTGSFAITRSALAASKLSF